MAILTTLSDIARLAINRVASWTEKEKKLMHKALNAQAASDRSYTDTELGLHGQQVDPHNTAIDNATGSWSPVIVAGGVDATMNGSTTGSYTRIGDRVFCDFYCKPSDVSAISTGAITIKGLPYTVKSDPFAEGGGTAIHAVGLTITAGNTITFSCLAGTSTFAVYVWSNTTGTNAVDKNDWPNDGTVKGMLVYSTTQAI